MTKRLYLRDTNEWIPDEIRYRVKQIYEIELIRGTSIDESGEPVYWVQTDDLIDPRLHMLLDLLLSEYIVDETKIY